MRAFTTSILIVSCVVGRSAGADRKDDLFASWQGAQRDVSSLIVEFTLKTKDLAIDKVQSANGAFRLIRTGKGEVFASYEVLPQGTKDDKSSQSSGLLNNGSIYLLNHDNKTAIKFEFGDGELRGFLEKYFNPFVRLLDKRRAEEQCKIKVLKQDKWYTYLSVKPKKVRQFGWFPDSFQEGRVVLMNEASDAVPKDMPQQFWYTDGIYGYTFEIKSWQLNPVVPPKLAEFGKPEDRPGWKVLDWNKFKAEAISGE